MPPAAPNRKSCVAIAKKGGVRLVGPNCIGLYSSQPSCALSVNAVLEQLKVTAGPLAIVSQSGSMMGGLLSRGLGRGVGFSKLISVGNECDLGVGEIADCLVDDPHTEAILLFMETIRGAEHLARAARRACAAGKPMIVYKLGRSSVGQDLAASHTGALAGDDAVADAFFRAHGIVRVDTLENLFELPPLLRGQKPARRHRVAVMTTTGGGAAAVADRLGTFGVDVVAPTREVIDGLAQKNIRISRRAADRSDAGRREKRNLQRRAECTARLRSLRPGARGRRQFGAVPAGGRDRAAGRGRPPRQADRGVPGAARRGLAQIARRK